MNNPFTFFDKIYCINLEKRTDRWADSQKEFEKLGILDMVERYTPIKHENPAKSLLLTNIKLLEIAKENNYKNVLILEDDVTFIDNTNEILNEVFGINKKTQLPDNWHMLYFGASACGQKNIPIKKYDDNIVKLIKGVFSTTAIAYNNIIYDQVINNLKKCKITIDKFYATILQKNMNFYLIHPLLCSQRDGFSDIAKKNRKFGKNSMLDFYKHVKYINN